MKTIRLTDNDFFNLIDVLKCDFNYECDLCMNDPSHNTDYAKQDYSLLVAMRSGFNDDSALLRYDVELSKMKAMLDDIRK